jgi:ABC-type branched-subunit amino acid transport system ATPase component
MPTLSGDRRSAYLVVADLTAGYTRGAPIINGVNLTAGLGEIVSVIGPNGAGKSTLLKAITRQIDVFSGTVQLGDEDVTRLRGDRLARRGLGYVPQVRDTFPTLTVLENLEMGGYLLPRNDVGDRIDEVMTIFPALASMRTRIAGRLSGGERKMLAIGRALMLRPRLLILDEPTANLSPAIANRVLETHVRAVAEAGTGIVLVEQRAAEALRIADWAYVLVGGSVHISARAGELLARPDIGELFLGRTEVTV